MGVRNVYLERLPGAEGPFHGREGFRPGQPVEANTEYDNILRQPAKVTSRSLSPAHPVHAKFAPEKTVIAPSGRKRTAPSVTWSGESDTRARFGQINPRTSN